MSRHWFPDVDHPSLEVRCEKCGCTAGRLRILGVWDAGSDERTLRTNWDGTATAADQALPDWLDTDAACDSAVLSWRCPRCNKPVGAGLDELRTRYRNAVGIWSTDERNRRRENKRVGHVEVPQLTPGLP